MVPKHEELISSAFVERCSAASLGKSDCKARSHNLIVPSVEHVANEIPPEQPLAMHARDGSCMFSQHRFLISHMHDE